MADSGALSQNVFAFYMDSYARESTNPSFIDFGSVQQTHMRNPSDLVYIPLVDHMYWMNYGATGVRIGEQITNVSPNDPDDGFNAFNFGEQGYQIIFDTGTSLVYFPHYLFADFIVRLLDISQLNAKYSGGYYAVDCRPQDWPSVYLQVSNYWFEMSPEHYIVDASVKHDGSQCMLAFAEN
jgi:hypothetical protein